MNLIERYSNKEVSFRFNGVNLSFFLSQSLFSSYAIDAGTKLLLKTVAKEVDFTNIKTAADIGCGVGVIGLSLKAKHPGLNLILQDRDALAISFSKENARRNKIRNISYIGDLALEGLEENSQNLIISNLPAKAGETVLQDFINRSLIYLSVNGICIVVVVSTLRDTILTAIRKTDAKIVYSEDTREYSVFHFKKMNNIIVENKEENKLDLRKCYIRETTNFKIKKLNYTLKSVFNLPGFDTVPYYVDITAHLLEKQPISGCTLFWNPEQGHLPLIIHLANKNNITQTVLASRDILQLKISRDNLLDTFGEDIKEHLTMEHICCPEELCTDAIYRVSPSKTPYNSIIVFMDSSNDTILESFLNITAPDSILILTGKSSNIAGAVKTHKGWIQLTSRKYRGFRVVIFKKG